MILKWRISILLFSIVLGFLTFFNYNHRIYDWDMPGYIGSMYKIGQTHSEEQIRELTYLAIKKEAPADHYKDIDGTQPYDKVRIDFTNDTRAFAEQMPYFQIKVGYVFVVKLLHLLGLSTPMSVLGLSLISYFITGILLFYLSKIIVPNNVYIAFAFSLFVMILPPMLYMARVSTPDMFIFQFLILFMIGIFKKWSALKMFFLLLLITFIRPDYVTFGLSYLGALGLFILIKQKKLQYHLIAQGIALVILNFAIMKYYNYPGWKDLFYDSFIQRRSFVSTDPMLFTWKGYFSIIYIKIIYFKKITLTVSLLLFAIFFLSKDLWVRILSCLFFCNVYIKFLFFPESGALRFFFVFVALLLIMLLSVLAKKYNGFKLNKIA